MTNLLEVQKAALSASKGRSGFAYFLEQGLGKTLLTLTDFTEKVAAREVTRLVVVCPNSFKDGWREEIEKHGFDFEVLVYESGNMYGSFLRKAFNKPPVVIVNYEAIRRENTYGFIEQFAANRNCMIVFDESISLKNNKAKQTKAAIILARRFKYQRVLSGKPITQGPHDLWGQMRVIHALEDAEYVNGWNYYVFRGTFCRMGGYMNRKVVGVQNPEKLAKMIDPHVFRATKAEWTDLPEKMYTMREYKMSREQQDQYDSMEREFMLWLTDSEVVTVDMAISKYIKMAQIQSGFIIKEDGTIRELVKPSENPRLNLIREVIENSTGKVIVPYFHRHSGQMLAATLSDYCPSYIHGNMTGAEISANKQTFNEDSKCRVILTQIRAAKFGHTLLGGTKPDDRCNTMVFFENTYSLDDRAQIEDRMHRHGQVNACLYIDLWGTDLDHKVARALQAKEAIFQAVFEKIRGKHGKAA